MTGQTWPAWATERVSISESDPSWLEQGGRECTWLGARLTSWLVDAVEHVGSTAVPGLIAKPILDYQSAVADLDCATEVADALSPDGWHLVPPELDQRPWERFFVRVEQDRRRAHLHLMTPDSPRLAETVVFRDALRADPELVGAYAELKIELAARFEYDREAYSRAKAEFVREVLTRCSYDTLARDYAAHFRGDLDGKPLDRALLAAFAELVLASGGGPVVDAGSGTGRATAHLHTLGLDVSGIDLSPRMVEVARESYPAVRFDVGSMTELNLPDHSLNGLLAYYSIIHIPDERLPALFTEFHRVLAPGGYLLLAFQVGDGSLHLSEALGHAVALEFRRLQPDRISALLERAGLIEQARTVRKPQSDLESTRQGYLLARSEGPPTSCLTR